MPFLIKSIASSIVYPESGIKQFSQRKLIIWALYPIVEGGHSKVIDREKTHAAVKDAFHLFLRNEIKKQMESGLVNSPSFAHIINTHDERPQEAGDDKCI